MNNKGQGLSMNVIIIAAIALLILVILSVLVLQTGEKTSRTGECSSVPGSYCEDIDSDCDDGYTSDAFRSCRDDDEKCCIPVGANN